MDRTKEFFIAIKGGELNKVRSLLKRAPQLILSHDEQGVSAIMTAVYYGQQQIVQELLSRTGDINIWEAAATGHVDQVEKLLDADHSLLNAYSPDGFTPLALAAFFGQKTVLDSLIARGAEVNIESKNDTHVRPLHSAAAHHNPQVAKLMMETLLERGAEVNARQSGGWTALHEAASRGDVEMVRLLKRHGADKELKSEDGRTPRELAREKGHENILAIL